MALGNDPPVTSQCPVEWCLYGKVHNVYIIACHTDPMAFAREHGRESGDGSRLIRIVDARSLHRHAPGGCIPTVALYSARRAYDVKMAINRSIVAGERIIEL